MGFRLFGLANGCRKKKKREQTPALQTQFPMQLIRRLSQVQNLEAARHFKELGVRLTQSDVRNFKVLRAGKRMLQLADEVYAKPGRKPKLALGHKRTVVSNSARGNDRSFPRADRFDPPDGLLADVLRFQR